MQMGDKVDRSSVVGMVAGMSHILTLMFSSWNHFQALEADVANVKYF